MPGKSAEAIWKLEFGASVRNGGQTEFRVWAPKVKSLAVRILGGHRRTIPMTCESTLAESRPEFGAEFVATVPGVGEGTDYFYVLDGEREGNAANPRYVVSKFNDLRPQLLAEATKNARSIAQQFAADSGVQVGRIHSANQGMIQIFGSDGNDESSPYSPTSTPVKKIRVVSTFEFELQ